MIATYTVEEFDALFDRLLGPEQEEEVRREQSGVFQVPEKLSQGDRHTLLYKFLRSQKARNVPPEVAIVGCMALNEQKCEPPVSEKELRKYLERVWKQDDSPEFKAKRKARAEGKAAGGEGADTDGFELAHGKRQPNSQKNIALALQKLNVQPAFDEFADKILLNVAGRVRDFDDRSATTLHLRIEREFEFLPSREKFDAVVKDIAWKNSRHPVKTYLASLRWDGTPRIDEWLIAYGGAPDTRYVRAVSSLILIAAVRRVHQPGCKFDEMPVLESSQGTGKSTMLRLLCPAEDWFSDDLPLNVDSKQVIERTVGKWIIEAAELSGNRQVNVEQLKGMTSRRIDGPVRLAYARLPVSVPRQFVIIGTTNAALGYLKDSTGNRRFWPVRVGTFDLESLDRDRDQLWAEAVVREAAGESIRLDPSLYGDAAAQQQQRELVDPWYELLSERIGDDVLQISTEDVWNHLSKLDVDKRNNHDSSRVGEVMQKLGFKTRKKLRVPQDGKTVQRVFWLREGAHQESLPELSDGGQL